MTTKTKRKRKVPYQFRFDPEIAEALDNTADQKGITMTSIVEKALRKELEIAEDPTKPTKRSRYQYTE